MLTQGVARVVLRALYNALGVAVGFFPGVF